VRQIATNAGHDGAVVSGNLLRENDETQGFNASTDVYENLVAAGVIDPTKVVRTALQDAASVAGLLITTEAAISRKARRQAGHRPGGNAPAISRRHGRHGRHDGLLRLFSSSPPPDPAPASVHCLQRFARSYPMASRAAMVRALKPSSIRSPAQAMAGLAWR
jgi:hypothetical protein